MSPLLERSELALEDFLGGPGVKNSPSNAGDIGSILGQGTKIPHAACQLLSLSTLESRA